jgi:hypothetical protein
MLIKEYRIPLPLTVEEYRIAQLYMIAVSQRKEEDKITLPKHTFRLKSKDTSRLPINSQVVEICISTFCFQLQKKSRDESKGVGSGVEIHVNEPYDNGPGGSGQYTRKVYHVGSHLPGWFKSLLPKSALTVEEEAWNAYPYTKTRYTCPFIQRFSLEIETSYCADAGHQENVFGLSGSDLRNRGVGKEDFHDVIPFLHFRVIVINLCIFFL